jgi:hypothetical protein
VIFFKNFFAESQQFGSRQRSLCQVFISLLRVFLLGLGKEATLTSVFSLPRVFIWLSAKPSLPRVFYLTLGKDASSRQSHGFR